MKHGTLILAWLNAGSESHTGALRYINVELMYIVFAGYENNHRNRGSSPGDLWSRILTQLRQTQTQGVEPMAHVSWWLPVSNAGPALVQLLLLQRFVFTG